MGLIANDWRTVPLFVQAKRFIRDVMTVLDVGAGLRPQTLVHCERNVCMEPHDEYVEALEDAGFLVLAGAAPGELDQLDRSYIGSRCMRAMIDTVVMLDVIEHMERDDGLETIRRACEIARQQVIVFTPLGFMPQSGGEKADAWGMQGQHWQEHRSGWMPDDFPGWLHLVDKNFALGHAAFFAIWNRSV